MAVCEEYKKDPNVAYCEPNYIFHTTRLNVVEEVNEEESSVYPNDPYFSSTGTWGQDYPDMWGLEKIEASAAWQFTQGSSDVIVAISDTGIDYNHPDIQQNVWINLGEVANDGIDNDNNGYIDDVRGYDFTTCATWGWSGCDAPKDPDNNPIDDNGHGTHVAGTISAVTNNGTGIAGISWYSKVMPVKGLNYQGGGSDYDLANTIFYATDNGADVINMSWGGYMISPPQTLKNALDYAYGLGVTMVAAAGNDNVDARFLYPANYMDLITVAASNHEDKRSSFSNYGSKIDVAAPGGDGKCDNWEYRNDTNAYGGGYHSSDKIGAYTIFILNGVSNTIWWYTLTGPDRGIVDLYIDDGSSKSYYQSFDNYSPTLQFVQKVFIMPPGVSEAELYFQVSRNKDPHSTGYRMDMDAIAVLAPSETIFDDDYDELFRYYDGVDELAQRNILSLRASGTDMYGDGYSIVGSQYYRSKGTSMAAPHVSGLAALLLDRFPNFNSDQVKAAIKQGADDIVGSGVGWDHYTGNGRINAYKSLQIGNPLIVKISNPPNGDILVSDSIVDIRGTASGGGFENYKLEYGVGINPTSWNLIYGPEINPVTNGLLAQWDTHGIAAGIYSLKLTATMQSGLQFQHLVQVGIEYPFVQITAEASSQYRPAISGDKIVWYDSRNGNSDIYLHDLYDPIEAERQITTNSADQYFPAISGSRIVWEDNRDGNEDIYYCEYDPTTQTCPEEQITANPVDQMYPAISGGKIVWCDYRNGNPDIYLYDLSDPTHTERQITTNSAEQSYPAISGDKIVWHDNRNGNEDIYYCEYDPTTQTCPEEQITTNSAYQFFPAISGGRIVWQDYRNGNADIYLYDLSTDTERQITFNTGYQFGPDISGDKIVWYDSRNGNSDIYLYDLYTNTERQITANPTDQYFPAISGDKIVWQDYRNDDGHYNNSDIYLYELSPFWLDDFASESLDTSKWTSLDRVSQANGKAVFQGDGTEYRTDGIQAKKNFNRDKDLTFRAEFSFEQTNPGFNLVLSGEKPGTSSFRKIWLNVNGAGFSIYNQVGSTQTAVPGNSNFPAFNTNTSYTVEFRWLGDPEETNRRLEIYLYETSLGFSSVEGPVYIWNVMDWDPTISAGVYYGNGTSYLDSVYVIGPSDAMLEQNVPVITGFQGKKPSYLPGERISFTVLGEFIPGPGDPNSNTIFSWASHQPMPVTWGGYANGYFYINPLRKVGTYYFTVRLISDTGLMDAQRFSVTVAKPPVIPPIPVEY